MRLKTPDLVSSIWAAIYSGVPNQMYKGLTQMVILIMDRESISVDNCLIDVHVMKVYKLSMGMHPSASS